MYEVHIGLSVDWNIATLIFFYFLICWIITFPFSFCILFACHFLFFFLYQSCQRSSYLINHFKGLFWI